MAENTLGSSIIDQNGNEQSLPSDEVISDKDSSPKSSLASIPASSTSGEDHTETTTHPDALIEHPPESKDELTDQQNSSRPDREPSEMRRPDGADSGEESEDEDIFDVNDVDDECRVTFFERGLAYHKSGKQGLALKCYLMCLKDLSQECRFTLLPQCLRNVADIYYAKEEYEKAVYFIQAEKLFYENALIDTRDLQARIDNDLSNNGECDLANGNLDALRAEEYEHLAKLCVDTGQSQLALEYAGKSTKLRQQIFGDGHNITRNSLDFFATVYADVGKQQYSESLEQLDEEVTDDVKYVADVENMNADLENINADLENINADVVNINADMEKIDADAEPADEIIPPASSPTSILKNRKSISDSNETVKKVTQQVRFDASVRDKSKEKEESITHFLLLMLFFVCFVLLTILGFYIFCRMERNSTTCSALRSEAHYVYMRLKYYFYHYMSTSKKKYT